MVTLRHLFRRGVVGECKSAQYNAFWTAVRRFSPTTRFSGSASSSVSTKSVHELLPAYDLVAYLLKDKHPDAWGAFLANGSSVHCSPVPVLRTEVDAFLAATEDIFVPVRCAGRWRGLGEESQVATSHDCVLPCWQHLGFCGGAPPTERPIERQRRWIRDAKARPRCTTT